VLLPTVKYYEQAGNWLISRPYYFISGLSFFVAGFWLFAQRNKLARDFGFVTIGVGLSSEIYDATYSYLAQLFDLTMMLVVILFIFNLATMKKYQNWLVASLPVAVLAIYLLKGTSGDIIFGIWSIVTIVRVFTDKSTVGKKYFFFAFLALLVGFICWFVDLNKIFCAPNGLLNGRAVLHYLMAAALVLVYKYFDSNKQGAD
jgi:hypothetical protein